MSYKIKYTLFILFLLCSLAAFFYYSIRVVIVWQQIKAASGGESLRSLVSLEVMGSTNITLIPPGRGFFRPGGIVYLEAEPPIENLEDLVKEGELHCLIKDVNNKVLFDGNLEFYGSRGYSCATREIFNSGAPLPFSMILTVKKPIPQLSGKKLYVYARHFTCGCERLIVIFDGFFVFVFGIVFLVILLYFRAFCKKFAIKKQDMA